MSSPNAQMPAETFHSVRLGRYSTISCMVEGMKPGTIRPMPFSIHTPMKAIKHAVMTYLFWFEVLGENKEECCDEVACDGCPDPWYECVFSGVGRRRGMLLRRCVIRRCRIL